MTGYQQYGYIRGYAAGENGFQFPQTAPAQGPTKQSTFAFRKRFERIDWKRLGKFSLFVCLFLSVSVSLFVSVCQYLLVLFAYMSIYLQLSLCWICYWK